MKYYRNKAYPNPVLRPENDDFIGQWFKATYKPEIQHEKGVVCIDIQYELSSVDINTLIKSNKAAFVTVVSCRDTYFSMPVESCNDSDFFEFSCDSLRGDINCNSYIRILENINFSSAEVHDDFGKGIFHYSVGDIIAECFPQSFYLERDLYKSLLSIFILVKQESLKGGDWSVDLDSDYIQIEVSPFMKDSIDNARNNKQYQIILLNSLYFAATMQAIECLKADNEQYESFKWAGVITQLLLNYNLNIEDRISRIVNTIMQEPLLKLDEFIFRKGLENEL